MYEVHSALLGNVAASAATPIIKAVVRSDPHGDVKAASEITAKQRDTVDLTGVSYRVDRAAGTLVVRFDLVKRVAGTQFLGTVVHGGDFDLERFSTPDASKVRAFDGDHLYGCQGSEVVTSYARDYVKHVIPLDCVSNHSPATLRSTSTLARNNGSQIAKDATSRTRSIELS